MELICVRDRSDRPKGGPGAIAKDGSEADSRIARPKGARPNYSYLPNLG